MDLGHAAFESAYAREGMFVSAASVLSGRARTQCTNPRARSSKCYLVLCGDPLAGQLGAQHTEFRCVRFACRDTTSHNSRAHLAWGAGLALCRPQRNRLKIGLRREGTVSDDLLETRRLTRTDGGDPAFISVWSRVAGATSWWNFQELSSVV